MITQKRATTFLEHYNYNIDKRIKLVGGGGMTKLVCKRFDDRCGWRVDINRQSIDDKRFVFVFFVNNEHSPPLLTSHLQQLLQVRDGGNIQGLRSLLYQ